VRLSLKFAVAMAFIAMAVFVVAILDGSTVLPLWMIALAAAGLFALTIHWLKESRDSKKKREDGSGDGQAQKSDSPPSIMDKFITWVVFVVGAALMPFIGLYWYQSMHHKAGDFFGEFHPFDLIVIIIAIVAASIAEYFNFARSRYREIGFGNGWLIAAPPVAVYLVVYTYWAGWAFDRVESGKLNMSTMWQSVAMALVAGLCQIFVLAWFENRAHDRRRREFLHATTASAATANDFG
jgi:hypothetical protein